MCIECDSWAHCDIEYKGHGFCSSGCLDRWKERECKNDKQQVERIDEQIKKLQMERDNIMKRLGYHRSQYPWS